MKVWMDFTCPFCLIGLKRMKEALKDSKLGGFKLSSFRLSPKLKENVNYIESLSKKYNVNMEKAMQMTMGPTNTLKSEGLDVDFLKIDELNTTKAHMLLKNFENDEKYLDLAYEIFTAYFVEAKNINDEKVLQEVLNKLELNGDVENILKNDTLLEKVLEDSKIAKSEGINLIPTIVLSSGEKIEGSQSTENYLEIMNFEAK
ncbi:DsbA family protein [Mediannikoviicoccus vaginalis]|uniref:DsbA family protein n=1 Tax=Mediannikoviicoccus vaginalis TaxID=2899727 RepID=UPI001F02C2EF|nr:DsbA family protein [Mediannikoviicoccus vaginalis]